MVDYQGEIMQILIFIYFLIGIIFLAFPASLGYWYIFNNKKSFEIPMHYWLLPTLVFLIGYLYILLKEGVFGH